MKLSIIGAGKIVMEFLDVVKEIDEIKLHNICATKKSEKKLKMLQESYNIKNYCTDIDELMKDESDAVYIALPNHLHYKIGKEALLNNKNIIMEKPFTSNYEEAKELVELAEQKGLIIFEAISNQFLPNYKKTKELIKNIGNIKIVEMNFSQYSSKYDAFKKDDIHSVFDSTKAGGALMDLNLYNIYFIVGLFGEPTSVQYFSNIEKSVDTSGILIMDYVDFKCVAVGSKDSNGLLSINIQGDKGYICSNDAPNSYNEFDIKFNDGEKEYYSLNNNKHRLYYEIVKFNELLKNKNYKEAKYLNKNTLSVMSILDKARENQ